MAKEAKEKTVPPTDTGEAATVTGETDTEPKYSVESLGKHCLELFGVTSSTYAGATFDMEGEYTVQQMREHIEAWKKREAH